MPGPAAPVRGHAHRRDRDLVAAICWQQAGGRSALGSPSLMMMMCLVAEVLLRVGQGRRGPSARPGRSPACRRASSCRSSPGCRPGCGPTCCIGMCHLQLKSKSITPTSSLGPSRSTASLAIFFCQRLPSAISEACMISTRPPLPCTLSDLISAVHRQRLLDGRVLPAAGPEAVRPADHHQAAALVVRVAANHFLLFLADALGRARWPGSRNRSC